MPFTKSLANTRAACEPGLWLTWRTKQAASQHALVSFAQKPLLEATNVGYDPARSTSPLTAFCSCLCKKLWSQELLPYCTRKQHSHRNIWSCLLPHLFHSGKGEWEALFYLKTSYSFCQQTGWTLKKSSRILFIYLRLVGHHAYKMIFCRQQSSAQAEWILCHLRHVHKTGLLKGRELCRRVIRGNSHSNSNECFNRSQKPYCIWRKKYSLPTHISSSCQTAALFWELFSPDRKYSNTSKLWSSFFHQEKETSTTV